MADIKQLIRDWSQHILEGYIELGQKVYEEELFKQLQQYCKEGVVDGLFDSNTTDEEIKPWLTNIAKSVNERYLVQMRIDDLLMHRL